MKKNNIILAKKYATAFFNLYSDKINEHFFWTIKSAYLSLEENSEEGLEKNNMLMYFSLSSIPLSLKEKGVNLFLENLNLQEFKPLIKNLIILLIKQNRVLLFTEVLKSLCLIFQEKTNTILFKITSSYTLQDNELAVLNKFLVNKTGKKIMLQHKIDKDLIGGIRMQSNTLLWEYSVRKQLHNAKQSLIG